MKNGRRRWLMVALGSVLVGSAGCTTYTIDAMLRADGSGSRFEEVRVQETEDVEVEVSRVEYRRLMNLTERDGWNHTTEDDGGDTAHVFTRRRRLSDPGAWSRASGDIHITGARPADANDRVGHIRLGEVRFLNEVNVAAEPSGSDRTLTYRERFYWENALDVIIETRLQYFAEELDAAYPRLDPGLRGELVGLVRGGLWALVDRGVLDAKDDEADELLSAFLERTTDQAVEIMRPHRRDAGEEFFGPLLREVYEDEEDRLNAFLDAKLPGVELAGNTEIRFRLTLPGRVLESNAHERDDDVLVWKFSPAEALSVPIEVYAKSVVEG